MDEIQRQTRANKIFQIIRDFETYFPDHFRKCGIHKCGHCEGTGFIDKHALRQCGDCGGMGYRGYERIRGEFVCRRCNGYGCDRCDMSGFMDWVAHARGTDLEPFKKPRNYKPPEST